MTKHSLYCNHYKLSFIHFRLALPKAFKIFVWLVGFVRETAWGKEENRDIRNEGNPLRWVPRKDPRQDAYTKN